MSNFNNFSNQPHRYSLEKGGKKHHCPYCNKKTFVLYIDIKTGNYLPEQYGRCDRESKCRYHLLPPLETLCFFVPTDEIRVITEKAILIKQGKNEQIIPQKAVFEQMNTGIYLADFFIKNTNGKRTEPLKIRHIESDYKYFSNEGGILKNAGEKKVLNIQPPSEPVFFDFNTFSETLKPERYEKNTFIQNLFYKVQFPFDLVEVTKVIQLYRLGTVANGYRAGANTFPFIDIKGNVRAVQVKQFDEQNHTTGTDFLHSIIEKHHTRNNKPLPEWLEAYIKQDKRISCLFGEHLLSKYHSNPVALVEAPKTAIYCWLYFNKSKFPIYKDCIWLAVGAKGYLNFDVAKILKGRFVYVLPDLSKDGTTFKEWETKVKEYEKHLPGTSFIMDDLLEKYGTPEQREQGADIADVLNFDWRTIKAETKPLQPEPEKVTIVTKVTYQQNILFSHVEPLPKIEVFTTERIEHPKKEYSENWSKEIATLENYFTTISLSNSPVRINEYSIISNPQIFIESHLNTLKTNNGNRTFYPFLIRLNEFAKHIKLI